MNNMRFSEIIKNTAAKWGLTIGHIRGEDCSRLNVFDLCVSDLMNKIRPRSLFFIQIGANDGVRNDPIHNYIIKNNWGGILIEPQPIIFNNLLKNYEPCKNLFFENIAIGISPGVVPFYYIKNTTGLPEWMNGIASFNKKHVLKHVKSIGHVSEKLIEVINVKCLTVSDLRRKYKFNDIDLLQVDTEGYDFEIIKLFFKESLSPTLINFEHVHLKRVQRLECFRFLAERGYGLFSSNTGNTVAYKMLK